MKARDLLLSLILLLAACRNEQAIHAYTETQTATIKAKPAITPTSTLTPLPTPTRTPSPTPLPAWCPAEAWERAPRADKLRIAFVCGGYADPSHNACLWTEGEGQTRLTDGAYVDAIALSDDGQYVAFTRLLENGQVELWSIRSDGSDERLLVTPDRFGEMREASPEEIVIPMDVHFVPGTHMIAFHSNLAGTGWGFFYTPDDLWWADPETGRIIEKPVSGEIFYSPDGQWAAVVNEQHLILMAKEGSNQRIVELGNYHTLPYGATYNEPPRVDWAGDSRSLFVSVVDAWDLSDAEQAIVTIWQVDIIGTPPMKIADCTACYVPLYSPDHRFMSYVRLAEEGSNRWQLFLRAVDSPEELLYYEEDFTSNANWAPDSQSFIFWAKQKAYLGHICQKAKPIPHPGTTYLYGVGVWLNDNEYLLGLNEGSIGTLYLGNADPSAQSIERLFGMTEAEAFDWTWMH